MYKGTERTREMKVYVDNNLVTTWTSSGTTDGFEIIDLSETSGEVIQVTGVLADSQWLSITEVRPACSLKQAKIFATPGLGEMRHFGYGCFLRHTT